MQSNKKKRLSMEIAAEMHKQLKIRAASANLSITDWVLQAIIQKLTQEENYNEFPPLSR